MRITRVLNASVNHFILSVRQPKKIITTVHNFFPLTTRIQLLIDHFFRSFAVKQTLGSIQLLGLKMFSSKSICENFVKITFWFPKKTSKNDFLAVCLYIDEIKDLHEVNSRAPFGGKIGAGHSLLHKYLKFSKILRMHAIYHDAYSYMRSSKNVGPGYVYTLTTEKYFRNSMLLGHISGILYWTLMKLFNSRRFDNFRF